jgi:hypothetical protein
MVKTKLVEELINDGAELLHELDRHDFPVESMFWIHLQDQDYWRLVIASPIVAEQGGAAAYHRLGEIMRGIEFAGISLEDTSLLDPKSQQFQSFLSVVNSSSRLAAGAEWLKFEDAVVYRWTSASVNGDLTCEVSRGELRRFWEVERKMMSLKLPALLIDVDKRRVTLRFHPRQGPQGDIGSVKKPFELALHRANARPDCQIKWLN